MTPGPRPGGFGQPAAVAALALALLALAAPAIATPDARTPAVSVDPGTLQLPEGLDAVRQVAVAELQQLGARLQPPALRPVGRILAGGGVTVLAFEEHVGGVPVFRGRHQVAVRPDGRVLGVVLGETVAGGTPGAFLLTAAEAARLAAAAVAGTPPGPRAPRGEALAARDVEAALFGSPGGTLHVTLEGLAEPARVAPVVVAEGPWSAWRVDVARPDDPLDISTVLVDAVTGDLLSLTSITDQAAARGRVFPRGAAHGSVLVDFVDDEEQLSPASPAGWVAVDASEGNNLFAEDDRAGDSNGTPGVRAIGTGDPLLFDFPVTGMPLDDLEAGITNAFWATNFAHDRLHALGFDEPSGAAQLQNFGRGGIGNDRTRVFVQYQGGASATNVRNSNFATTALDGGTNTVGLGLWDLSGQIRDGALDTGLVMHEYVHLAVTRLAGGDPTCDDGTQPSALSEGWADFFAASWTDDPVIGEYVSGDAIKGIRTVSLDQNRYSYANLCFILGDYCNRYENGEIWAATLWDLRRAFVLAYGPVEGVLRCERVVLEGLRYTPCRPTFPQARDGILLADTALTGGANHCLIWGALAARGLGAEASSASPDDPRPRPGFQLPASCMGAATLAFDRPRYGDDADARLVLAEPAAGGAARDVVVTSSSGDTETLRASGPAAVRTLELRLVPGPAVPGDGRLQVADGDALQAACAACAGSPSGAAVVSRAVALNINIHRVTSGSCDADTVADFPYPELPGLLDAGEVATLTVTLGNAETFALDDVRVRVSDDHPGLSLIPGGEIPFGRVPARQAQPWPFNVVLRAIVDPAPAVMAGDIANVRFDVTARGLAGSLVLPLELGRDYTVDRDLPAFGGTETFEPGSPSRAGWTHAPAFGQPADEWTLQGCGDGGGTAMAYSGPGCTDYPDTPSAATLVSPPLIDLAGGVVAVHPRSLTWRNDVDLARDPRSLYCDSEMVLLYMTDDPDRPAYGNPIGDRNNATQYWAQWTGLSNERNTNGWETGLPRNAITNTTLAGRNLANVRLYWVFMTDVYNAANNGGCRLTDPDAVAGGYRLDNVSFTYDAVRTLPQADTSCLRTCGVRGFLDVTPANAGLRCPGDALQLSGARSEGGGCPTGELEYQFTGPGLNTGYTPSPLASAVAAPGATWTLRVRCRADTSCSETVSVADPTLEDSQAGRVWPGSLRVSRSVGQVLLTWDGTRSPEAYAVFAGEAPRGSGPARVSMLSELAVSPPDVPLRRGSADALWFLDTTPDSGPGLTAYRVFARAPCLGTAFGR